MPVLEQVQPVRNYIGGRWTDSTSTEFAGVANPATGESIGRVPLLGQQDVGIKVEGAPAVVNQNVISGNGTGVLISGTTDFANVQFNRIGVAAASAADPSRTRVWSPPSGISPAGVKTPSGDMSHSS